MKTFNEDSESFSIAEAVKEAQRCLNCKVPNCKKGCPISNDIPDWISELAKGNFGNSMKIINGKSNLPAVCGRVCAHEKQCEGNCILGKKGTPVAIGKLERFVADFDSDAGLTHENIPEKSRGKVAVIGSGPAGLTIAGDLSRKGFAVEIFEMEHEPGGVLMYGIPEYRLPKEVVRREIKRIEQLGVVFHLNTVIGEDITVDKLFDMGFDAIFMGTGTGVPKRPQIPGIDHPGVRQAIRFLRRVSLYESGSMTRNEIMVDEGDRVFVLGAGNTGMDAARTALRLGAREVVVVSNTDIDHMSALRSEYEDALAEGVKFMWDTVITRVNGGPGEKLDSLELETSLPDGKEIQTLRADRLILAIGSSPAARIVSTTKGIEVDENGYVLTREQPFGMTTRKGVFAGGDVTKRPATVVHAMHDAKTVAEGIEKYIDAVHLMDSIDNP